MLTAPDRRFSLPFPGRGGMVIAVTEPRPYHLWTPETIRSAAVFSSPHSGRDYPASLLERTRLDPLAIRSSEDAFVDRLFAPAVDVGAPLLAAKAPRAYIDLNRGPEELDPAVISGIRATGLNPRVAAGLGVIPRIVAEGQPIYNGKISRSEAEKRIATFHRPYHAALEALMIGAVRQFGYAIVFDCHSMPTDALRAAPRVKGLRADIVLGDRFGASADRDYMAAARAAFVSAGFAVATNAPFAGGHITQRYGLPSRRRHAIQIEIDRGLYLDSKTMTPGRNYDDFADTLAQVIPALAAIGQISALAAE